MLREWEKRFPGRVENMFNALQNVVPSHLLDGSLYDFKNARATGVADENGDKAFDKEEFAPAPTLPGVLGVRVKIAKLEIFDDCEVAIRIETGQW